MINTIFFGMSIVLGFLAWFTIFSAIIWPKVKTMPREQLLKALISIHFFRYLGSTFIIGGVVAHTLATGFSTPAVVGDLIALALAFASFLALQWSKNRRLQNSLIWIFNLEGTLDLLLAYVTGALFITNPGDFGAVYFIPTFYVPLMLVSHFYIFKLLVQRRPAGVEE